MNKDNSKVEIRFGRKPLIMTIWTERKPAKYLKIRGFSGSVPLTDEDEFVKLKFTLFKDGKELKDDDIMKIFTFSRSSCIIEYDQLKRDFYKDVRYLVLDKCLLDSLFIDPWVAITTYPNEGYIELIESNNPDIFYLIETDNIYLNDDRYIKTNSDKLNCV